jgi:hypothetical protein
VQSAVAVICLAGCAASHYYERQSDRTAFYLIVPEARNVAFVSSLNAYNPRPASRVGDSRWMISVAAGAEFRYFYLVDGAVYVPECRLYEKDDFGSRNCVYVPDQ